MPDITDILQALPHAVTPGPAGPDLAAADVARGHRALRQRRRRRLAGVAGTAAAVAVAVVLVASPTPRPAAPRLAVPRPAVPRPAAPTAAAGSASQAAAANSPLMSLAARITASSGRRPGNASLVISTQVDGTKTMQVLYMLFTDTGAIYSGYSVNGIKYAIAHHQDQMSSGGYAPLVKAAILAATSSPAQGRTTMLEAGGDPLVGLSPAAQKTVWDKAQAAAQVIIKEKGGKAKPQPYSSQAVQRSFDNELWTYSTEALSAGDGNTLVRQGVLRLLSTISGVSVAHSATNGEATLTITAGPEVFEGSGSDVLTIDAATGMLVKEVSTIPGVPTAYTTYQTSRVTTAHL